MSSRKIRLTQAAVDKLTYDPEGPSRQIHWDEHLPGFGVRVYPSEKKSYVLYYGPAEVRKLMTLGSIHELTLKEAREKAAKLRVEVREGGDPARRIRRAKADIGAAPRLADLAEDFLSAKVRSGAWGNAHATESTRRMKSHIVPALGKYEPGDVTRKDVNALQIAVGENSGKVEANRVRSLLHHFLEWAREEEHFPDDRRNPAAVSRTSAIKPFREESRDRWLAHEEAPKLLRSLDAVATEVKDPYLSAIVRLLLLTGLRKSELLARTWADVDLKAATLSVPAVHKSGRPHTAFLSTYAVEILLSLPRGASADAPLFPTPRSGIARKDFKKSWRKVREKAGLLGGKGNLTVHDLRRTAGSWLFQGGVPKDVVARILQHAKGDVTTIYTRLDDGTAREAMEVLAETLRGLEPANGREATQTSA